MWILDTSVAVKWFFTDEKDRRKAHEVLDRLVENPNDFSVPALFFYELAAVLIQKSKFKKKFVQDSLDIIYQLGIPTFDLGEEVTQKAITISCQYQVSYYDALYVSLAELLKGVWLTADQKALDRLPHHLGKHLIKF
jgi:predicted nucleic acid-binding protein